MKILSFVSVVNSNLFLWPKPSNTTYGKSTALIGIFKIQSKSNNKILREAIKRYEKLIINEKWSHIVPNNISSTYNSKVITDVSVVLKSDSSILNMDTDESYSLFIDNDIIIKAENVFGAMKGLETLSQLITYDTKTGKIKIDNTPLKIYDEPRFKHRGLLLDTARNFYPINSIKRIIDAMAFNKLNVFHWHLFDATSFPFKSERYPELWKKGAYSDKMIYSKEDIRELINYALQRGVRIIPEIETPAHTYIFGKVFPELGVCLDNNDWDKKAAEPPSGQLDPTNPKSIKIVIDLIDELNEVFNDEYMHMSGDEVNYKCWETSSKINKYIKENNTNMNNLLLNFTYQMHKKALKNKKKIIVWEEILLNHNATLNKNSLVQVWLGASNIKKVVQRGYDVIASSSDYWYLDCGHGGWVGNNINGQSWCPYNTWQKIYSYNPVANLTIKESERVKGGEVALWSEQVDDINVEQYLWPRAAAAAEVLWAGPQGLDVVESLNRINNWRYRVVNRGVNAEPLQPLWCVKNPGRCNLP